MSTQYRKNKKNLHLIIYRVQGTGYAARLLNKNFCRLFLYYPSITAVAVDDFLLLPKYYFYKRLQSKCHAMTMFLLIEAPYNVLAESNENRIAPSK